MTNPPSPPRLPAWLQGKLIAVFTLGFGLSYGMIQALHDVSHQQPKMHGCATPAFIEVNRVDYERLKMGMSQVEIESILNPGIETSRSENNVRMIWENCDGSRILVTLENGVLKHKEQSGLQ